MNGIPDLLRHLDGNRQASILNLAYGKLSEEGITEVAKFLKDNPFVKHLDLRGNSIEPKGAVVLATSIRANRSLRSLNLKWNLIGKDVSGIGALCEMLKANLTIGQVDLRNNRIDSLGARFVGDMLTVNSGITHLDVSWNDFGVEGGLAVLEGLKQNTNVVECQLSGSKVGEEILHEVAFLLRRNRQSAAFKLQAQEENQSPGKASPTSQAPEGDAPDAQLQGRGLLAASKQWTVKESSSLMLRLLMRERDQKRPEDKALYQHIAEHIDKLLIETSKHKSARKEAEQRDKLAVAGFQDREQRYLNEIRHTEEKLQHAIKAKEGLLTELSFRQSELQRLEDQLARMIFDAKVKQEQAVAEEQQLKVDLRRHQQEQCEVTDRLALRQKDLEMLEEENERLLQHVQKFQRDIKEILGIG